MISPTGDPAPRRTTTPVLVVPSAARPESAARAINSYLANSAQHEDDLEVILSVQQGDEESAFRRYQDIASDLPTTVRLVLPEDHRNLIRSIADGCGVDLVTLEFLFRGTFEQRSPSLQVYGAHRNILIALTRGRDALFVDDDTVCNLRGGPSNPRVVEYWGHSSAATRLSLSLEAHPAEVSFVKAHRSLLGRKITEDDDDIEWVESCVHLKRSLGHGTVLVTTFGSYGDSGFVDNKPLLMSTNRETLTWITGGQYSTDRIVTSRSVVRSVRNFTVGHNPVAMSMHMGLRNEGFVPFFFPFGRGEDDLFIYTLLQVRRNVLTGLIPYSVLHDPEQRRVGSRPKFSPVFRDVIFSIFRSQKLDGSTAQDRYRQHAYFLAELLEMKDADVWEIIAKSMCDLFRDRIDTLIGNISSFPEGHSSWKAEVIRLISSADHALEELKNRPRAFVASGLPDSIDPLSLIRLYAKACLAWPTILSFLDKELDPQVGCGRLVAA